MNAQQATGLRGKGQGEASSTRARGRVLGIASGKGGVGKSALAVNLATFAAAAGASTLLIDGDLGLANADLLMGLVPGRDLGDWALGRCSLAEVLVCGPAGLELLVVGPRSATVALLEQGLRGSEGGDLSPLIDSRSLSILDLGAGIGRGVIDLARHCDPVWLVATPEPTSLADAYATAKQLWERAPRLRVELVVNRAADRATGERTHRALDRLVRRFLGRSLPLRAVLPEDPAMSAAVARQQPVVALAPRSPIARRIGLLAESLAEEIASRRRSGGVAFAPGGGA
jgi:flagellar biosynthesis protein FlhG